MSLVASTTGRPWVTSRVGKDLIRILENNFLETCGLSNKKAGVFEGRIRLKRGWVFVCLEERRLSGSRLRESGPHYDATLPLCFRYSFIMDFMGTRNTELLLLSVKSCRSSR
jgi:hypothetical protein